MKLLAETCDIARKFKILEQFQVSVEKKLLEPETAIVSESIGQTLPHNNIRGNSLTSTSVNNILKDRISFL